ncbi:hypothetical protein JZ751_014200 [Albula glossodonta]|uniref:Uncharacterized protein n=1 Tax=Albula glossodonta TaxID=121402 RepID=A0A8T2NVU2_9TELE|nr:hypothetical protein JZ751_014200 [Albula glossodonta]
MHMFSRECLNKECLGKPEAYSHLEQHWAHSEGINMQVWAYGAELSSEACRDLGFSSNLLCSSCDLLGQFSLSQLDPLCRQCCQEEAQIESRKSVRRESKRALSARLSYGGFRQSADRPGSFSGK